MSLGRIKRGTGGFLTITVNDFDFYDDNKHWWGEARDKGGRELEKELDLIIQIASNNFLEGFKKDALENHPWKNDTGSLSAGHKVYYSNDGAYFVADASIDPQGDKTLPNAYLDYALVLEKSSKYAWIKTNWDNHRRHLAPYIEGVVTDWLRLQKKPVEEPEFDWVDVDTGERLSNDDVGVQRRLQPKKFTKRDGSTQTRWRDPVKHEFARKRNIRRQRRY